MKILSILASPREGGFTAQLLEEAETLLRASGHEVERVDVARLHFEPCRGCMACRGAGRCILPADDASRFARQIQESDGLVIATPTYWGGIPGTLKALFDRCVYVMVDTSRAEMRIPKPLCSGRAACLLVTSTAMWPFNCLSRFTDTSGDLRRILRPSGFGPIAVVRLGNTKNLREITKRCKSKVARKVRSLFPA